MNLSKHTPGPLFVTISDEWPFCIETKNASGKVVFSQSMPCHSSDDKSARQALHCLNFKAKDRYECEAVNQRALADAILRAAAPELLAVVQSAAAIGFHTLPKGEPCQCSRCCLVRDAKAALSKATGEIP